MTAHWFKGIRTPEQAKRKWHELCRTYHPDSGGDPLVMNQINAEYQSLVTAFEWQEEWEHSENAEQDRTTARERSSGSKTTAEHGKHKAKHKAKGKARPATATSGTNNIPSRKKPSKKKSGHPAVVAQTPATLSSQSDIDELIDAGMEFGKALLKTVLQRRWNRNSDSE